MASYQVRMTAAYEQPRIRTVVVPENGTTGAIVDTTDPTVRELELIYKYGQNDFQPQPICSISVGDVIELNGLLFLVCGLGHKEISQADYEEFVKLSTDQRRDWTRMSKEEREEMHRKWAASHTIDEEGWRALREMATELRLALSEEKQLEQLESDMNDESLPAEDRLDAALEIKTILGMTPATGET